MTSNEFVQSNECEGAYCAPQAGFGGVVVLSDSLDCSVSERLRQERDEGLPVSISFEECSTWDADFRGAVIRHYTGSKGAPVGKKQGWRIFEHAGRITNLIGWIGLGEPSYKLAPRRRLGLQDARPLDRTVSNFIYRLEGARLTTARDILRQWMPVAADCWERRYGWRPVHWESMVGQGDAKVLGACFRGARWRRLGWTTGRTARRQTGNAHGKRAWSDAPPKLVFYFGPLAREPEKS